MDRTKQAENVGDIDRSPVNDREILFAGLKFFDNSASIRFKILLRVSEINLRLYFINTTVFEIRCMFYFSPILVFYVLVSYIILLFYWKNTVVNIVNVTIVLNSDMVELTRKTTQLD